MSNTVLIKSRELYTEILYENMRDKGIFMDFNKLKISVKNLENSFLFDSPLSSKNNSPRPFLRFLKKIEKDDWDLENLRSKSVSTSRNSSRVNSRKNSFDNNIFICYDGETLKKETIHPSELTLKSGARIIQERLSDPLPNKKLNIE